MSRKTPVELEGVPETLLMTLYNRAVESERSDPILRDQRAVQMVEQIDYDFARFGDGHVGHPIRAKVFDDWVREFLSRSPNGTVVNIGVGLSTQSERVDNGQARFIDIDLPEAIAVRQQFFEQTDRKRMLACSALDSEWMDAVDSECPVFFVAAGLLMFFDPQDVRTLIRTLATRFPGAEMAFDVIPTWFSRRSLDGRAHVANFDLPPMPWGLDYHRISTVEEWHPRIEVTRRRDYAQGFRNRWGLIGWLSLLPLARNRFMGTLVRTRFRVSE
jgi:O-methyltransferase involved in polyketide biosynthesis